MDAAVAPRRRAYKGGCAVASPKPPKCAWVVLIMIGESYVPGALVVAESLRMMKTKHDIVCMVTDDISVGARDKLRGPFDNVIEVPYVAHPTRPFSSKKQIELYGGWIDRSFTKWNCLSLVQYDRVILVDADIIAVTNCDDLFELRPPAACYTNPWAFPWQAGGMPNPYLKSGKDLAHGTLIPASQIETALRSESFVGLGAMVLLEPNSADYSAFLEMVRSSPVFGAEYKTLSGADEASIAAFYAHKGWTHIHQRYLAVPWKQKWVSCDIRAYHYHGRKPWDMDPNEWPDLADWWKIADRIAVKNPTYRETFYPKFESVSQFDSDIAQLRIANDLCATVMSSAGKGDKSFTRQLVGETISAWAMSLVNTSEASGWAKVYRNVPPEDAAYKALAEDLIAAKITTSGGAQRLVSEMASLVAGRLDRMPRPSKVKPAYDEKTLTYGSQFAVKTNPRIAALISMGGCEKTAAVALRYATLLGEHQKCIPQNHADFLYTKFKVTYEAFASPMDSRFFGKENAAYFSLFPDTDEVFGSRGNFFADANPISALSGNWFVHPPAARGVVLRSVQAVVDALDRETDQPRTIFILVPSCGKESVTACKALRNHRRYVSELHLEPESFQLENAAGETAQPTTPYTYIVLSEVAGAEKRAQLSRALMHIQVR